MKKYLIIAGIVILSLGLIIQMNISGNSSELILKEKNYSQIEDFSVKEFEDTVFLSVKTKAPIPYTSKEFETLDVISFGYSWLIPFEDDGGLIGIFSNVHTVDGFIGPWHSDQIRLVPKNEGFCVISEIILTGTSAIENEVCTLVSRHELHFDFHKIDRVASIALVENNSCDYGVEAKILKTTPSV